MRKRNIKSVAHWVIMSILLLFPVLMVGVSAFANDEQSVNVNEVYPYQTNEVNSPNDLIEGNVYHWTFGSGDSLTDYFQLDEFISFIYLNGNLDFEVADDSYFETYGSLYIDNSNIMLSFDYYSIGVCVGDTEYDYNLWVFFDTVVFADCEFDFIYLGGNFINNSYAVSSVSSSSYLGVPTVTVDIQNASYKQEVNNWANGFKSLPVNQWYGQLLNAIGVGQTENSVMNVIYVYPLYVLWVYILDIIVDCFLVIINFGHNALHRLGGDNE